MQGIRPFSLPDFLSHLKSTAPNPLRFRSKGLTLKGKVESDFYASFCMSNAFAGWLESKVDSLQAARAEARLVAASTQLRGQAGGRSSSSVTVSPSGSQRSLGTNGRSRERATAR
jgi:hypothetical protein